MARGGFVYIILNFQKRNPQHSPGVLGIDTGEVGTEKLIRESVIRGELDTGTSSTARGDLITDYRRIRFGEDHGDKVLPDEISFENI